MRSLSTELIYDTQTVQLPHGVRTVRGSQRRLLFTADEYEIVLEVVASQAAGWVRIAGQVLVNGEAVDAAAILVDDSPVASTDSDGRFKLVVAWTPRCGFWVQTADLLLIVPPFQISNMLAGAA